uniref:Alternative protein NOTCH1 n=1 Tax=Homo sapiens TaxID=9606 RepID=L8EAX5_HUMAN|nr:alternative protein NOTCH1 [Homo sapiens]
MPGPQPVPQHPLQERRDMPRGGPQRRGRLCLQLCPGLLWAPLPDTPGQCLPHQPLPQRGHLRPAHADGVQVPLPARLVREIVPAG